MSDRYYSPTQLKPLISLTRNECEYSGCDFKLVVNDIFLGEIAHISALSRGGPRYDSTMTNEERNSNKNLMVVCKNHHGMIDADVQNHPTALLQKMKLEHEQYNNAGADTETISATQIETIIEQVNSQQTNLNTGDGTQINNQQFIHNTAKQQDDHYITVKRNITRYSDRIRVELRTTEPRYDQVRGLLIEIVIGGAYEALEADDEDLYEKAINELRKISDYCYDDTKGVKQSPAGAHLKTLEFILYSCYEIGAYCIDKGHYSQLRYLVERGAHNDRVRTKSWIYMLSATIYRARSYPQSELFGEILNYVDNSLGKRIGWSRDETKTYLIQFECLANLIILYDRFERDFPVHAAYYDEADIYKNIELLILEDEHLSDIFPGVDRIKIAKALTFFDDALSNNIGLGLGGDFRWHPELKRFIEENDPNKQ